MANQEQLDILKQGVEAWNKWREEHPEIRPDLRAVDLRGADLREVNFRDVDLGKANLSRTNLFKAHLNDAHLGKANLFSANLIRANLKRADLFSADLKEAEIMEANLTRANLSYSNFTSANLSKANLTRVTLVGANMTNTILNNCVIYGISAWNVQLDRAKQDNLVITDYDEPTITVDNLEVAQFIYLLLNNPKIREVIDTVAKKAVLILGRFTPERKAVLDALREALRQHNYLPILFDFEKPASRDLTETISTLAHLARFVIADITDAKSVPQELMAIVPTLPSLAVQPLILASQHEYGMFEYFMRFPWVLPVYPTRCATR